MTSGKDTPVNTVTEIRKSSGTDTDSIVISSANKRVSTGVLALIRTRRLSNLMSVGVLCYNSRLTMRDIRVMNRETLLLMTYFKHSVDFTSNINVKLMHDVCFLTRDVFNSNLS